MYLIHLIPHRNFRGRYHQLVCPLCRWPNWKRDYESQCWSWVATQVHSSGAHGLQRWRVGIQSQNEIELHNTKNRLSESVTGSHTLTVPSPTRSSNKGSWWPSRIGQLPGAKSKVKKGWQWVWRDTWKIKNTMPLSDPTFTVPLFVWPLRNL